MKFCKNCGKELAEGVKFCKHCGHDIAENTTDQPQPSQPQQVKKEPVKLSKKSKLLMTIIGALIVLLFIGYKVGESMTSYEKKIEKFEEAMLEQDAKKVASLLVADTKNLTINKDTVKGFIDYYTNNPSEMNGLFSHLKDQGFEYQRQPDFEGDNYSYYGVNLIKSGKTFIYDNYQIKVSPVYFNVYTNYKDTEITMDGEVLATATSDEFSKEFGPYLPGTYTFSAIYKSDFVDLETEDKYTNTDPGYTESVDLYMEGEEVSFEVPYESGLDSLMLFINDKETGINILEQDSVGPVLTDGSMEVSYEAEFPWGKIKTANTPIESYYMDVSFSADDALKQTIQDSIVQYNKEYLAAITTAEAKHLTVAAQDLIDDIIDDAAYKKKYDTFYKGKFIGIDFDNESFDLSYSDYDGGWYIEVDTVEIFEEDAYYGPYDKAELELTEDEVEYKLVYNEKSETWLVSSIGYGYVEGNDMIEYREKEPKVFTSEWEWFE